MITYQQQLEILSSIFLTFESVEIKKGSVDKEQLKRYPLVYRGTQFETMTGVNFRVLACNVIIHNSPSNFWEFLKVLNVMTEKEIRNSYLYLLDNLQTYKAIIRKDLARLDEINLSAYEAFNLKEIHIFTLAVYYKRHPDELEKLCRTPRRYYERSKVLSAFFLLETDDL